MIGFFILVAIISILSRIPVGEPYVEFNEKPAFNPYNNGAKEKFVLDHAWEFKSLDDCMEFRELRQTGWRGNAEDFYRWKEEE